MSKLALHCPSPPKIAKSKTSRTVPFLKIALRLQ